MNVIFAVAMVTQGVFLTGHIINININIKEIVKGKFIANNILLTTTYSTTTALSTTTTNELEWK